MEGKEVRRRRRDSRRLSRTSEDGEDDSASSHEKCFYASFKIYLNPDSRRTSGAGGEVEDLDLLGPFTGTGEVVRIEKTEEDSDDEVSDEDEKTLSLSNDNILGEKDKEKGDDTDNEDAEIPEEFESEIPELTFVQTSTVTISSEYVQIKRQDSNLEIQTPLFQDLNAALSLNQKLVRFRGAPGLLPEAVVGEVCLIYILASCSLLLAPYTPYTPAR